MTIRDTHSSRLLKIVVKLTSQLGLQRIRRIVDIKDLKTESHTCVSVDHPHLFSIPVYLIQQSIQLFSCLTYMIHLTFQASLLFMQCAGKEKAIRQCALHKKQGEILPCLSQYPIQLEALQSYACIVVQYQKLAGTWLVQWQSFHASCLSMWLLQTLMTNDATCARPRTLSSCVHQSLIGYYSLFKKLCLLASFQ